MKDTIILASIKVTLSSILGKGKVTRWCGRVTRMSDFTGMTLILATSSGKVTRWMKFVFLSSGKVTLSLARLIFTRFCTISGVLLRQIKIENNEAEIKS